MLIKLWSISTTVRNPERLRGFLGVLAQMEGDAWNPAAQMEFQIRLIQARLYGARNNQFYAGLSQADINLLEGEDEISRDDAARIFAAKDYEDPAMRGRNSFKPLQKFGFADISNGVVSVTESGRAFLAEEKDYGEIFLRALLKWQIPNPLDLAGFPVRHGYNIKPFVGVLHLVDAVNRECEKAGDKQKGLSFDEFEIFGLTLIDWRKIGETAREVVKFRKALAKVPRSEKGAFIESESRRLRPAFNLRHLRDYADNAIRYFRMTGYIRVRGADDHIDIDPLRRVEVDSLLRRDSAKPRDFAPGREYAALMGDSSLPELPGESPKELLATINNLRRGIAAVGGTPAPSPPTGASASKLKSLRRELRARHLAAVGLAEKNRLAEPEAIRSCAKELRELTTSRKRVPNAPETLERLSKAGLDALNDAREIRANYPAGEDGMPTAPAPGGMPDIECRYDGFAAICEVTLLRDSKQWIHEGQPVVRHLRAFENKNAETESFCIFIAPKMHQDTLNVFHISVLHGYEGRRQKIAPITVEQFCGILDYCADRRESDRPLKRAEIRALLSRISESVGGMKTSDNWRKEAQEVIEKWKSES